ncbi:MAG TPA: alpha-galactosidase [Caldilineaceae bacterium]|nr:alpha-galactosidase [Caldilineaceae bacterium]
MTQVQNEWRITSKSLRCRVWLDEGQLLWALDSAGGRPVVAPSPMPTLSLQADPIRWTDLVEVQETQEPGDIRLLQVHIASQDRRLLATWSFQLFPDQPFVRLWGAVRNTGGQAALLEEGEMLRLALPAPEPLILFHVEQFSWVYRRNFFSQHQVRLTPGRAATEIRMGAFPSHFWGPTSCAWLALRTGPADRPETPPHTGEGIAIGIEFNGKSRLQAGATADRVQLSSRIDELHHRLAPGETFQVPAYFLGLFAGDWDEAGYVTQRFAERYVHPPPPDERFPWVEYNSWGYGQEIHEAQQLEAVERCARMGVEAVVLDLGWASQIGDWRAHPEKFPRGLAPIAERAHQLGLKFGVHMALAQAAPTAPVAQEHPDWLIHTGNDYFGAGPLCLGHRPCRDWLIEQIVRVLDDYDVDYIVQDGEDMVKLCHQQTHTHAPGDSNYANSTTGLDEVIETVRRLRPHVVWENCEDGGCMLTYKMARLYHTSITVDNIATYATRQGVYGASYPFSPRYSSRYMQDAPTPYTLRSAIFGGPLILMQRVTEWTDEQMAQTQEAIRQYKTLRNLIRSAKIIHLLPPRNTLQGLGWGWDAIQAVSPDQAQSVVMVYRAQGETLGKTIYPRGLKPDARYRVQMVDAGRQLELSGNRLMEEGVSLELPELSAEIIQIEQVA